MTQDKNNCKTFKSGEKVYFKREDKKEWKGPATVIGQDGKTVILKYGSNIVKTHETHVQETPYSFDRSTEDGRHALLDMVRGQRDEKVMDKEKEIEAVVNPVSIEIECDEILESNENIPVSGESLIVPIIPKIGQKVKFLPREPDEW